MQLECRRVQFKLQLFLYIAKQWRNTSKYSRTYSQMPRSSKISRDKKQARTEPVVLIPQGTYQCQKILDLKIERGQRQYLIKWKGYDGENDNTWEPLQNLEYLIEDLLEYEEHHSAQIQRLQSKWKKMYQNKVYFEPLEHFNVSKMKKKLEKMNTNNDQQISNSEIEQESEKSSKAAKQKKIYKKREGLRIKKQSNHQIVKGQDGLNLTRSRGRPSKNGVISQKIQISAQKFSSSSPSQQQILSSESNQQALLEQEIKKNHLFQTPERSLNIQEEKGTKSNQRVIRENQEELRNQQLSQAQKCVNNIVDQRKEPLVESKKLNSVALMLSKKMDPDKGSDESLEETKRGQSIFKNNNSTKYSHYDSKMNSNNSLHTSAKKYIYRPKRRSNRLERSDSQSESFNESLKHSLPPQPIIELEEEQKESTPMSSKYFQRNEAEDKKEGKDKEVKDLIPKYKWVFNSPEAKRASREQQSEQGLNGGNSLHEINENQQAPHSPQAKSDVNNHNQYSAQIQNNLSNKNVKSQLAGEKPENIQTDLSPFQKKVIQQPIIEVSSSERQEEDLHNCYEQVVLDSRQGKTKRTRPCYSYKSINKGGKTKAIKKRVRRQIDDSVQQMDWQEYTEYAKGVILQSQRLKEEMRKSKRGIVGRSQQSLVVGVDSMLVHNPSLNTLLQCLTTTYELRSEADIKLTKILASTKKQNVIIFSVEMLVKKQFQVRFITYQTIRQFFSKELLCYLEEQGKIEL